jgi:hypothetical protein
MASDSSLGVGFALLLEVKNGEICLTVAFGDSSWTRLSPGTNGRGAGVSGSTSSKSSLKQGMSPKKSLDDGFGNS